MVLVFYVMSQNIFRIRKEKSELEEINFNTSYSES